MMSQFSNKLTPFAGNVRHFSSENKPAEQTEVEIEMPPIKPTVSGGE
jgi:hypothetical protein